MNYQSVWEGGSKTLPSAFPLTMCQFVPPVRQHWSEAVGMLSVFPPDRGSQTSVFHVTLGYLQKTQTQLLKLREVP